MAIIMIQLASSEHWQVRSQCPVTFKGLVPVQPFSPPRVAWGLKAKHICKTMHRKGIPTWAASLCRSSMRRREAPRFTIPPKQSFGLWFQKHKTTLITSVRINI